ncbi:MAG: sugar ABC transporter substrate-binding protein [Myxococcales bacterium FL481]|nr:MAG: sugar ABC transporter substrate-binding protein [Myxococcales bacterium FL481]
MTASVARVLLVVILGLAPWLGCAAGSGYVWISDLPAADRRAPSDPVVRPGDTLSVVVRQQATLSGDFPVQDDGRYTQPLVGHIPVEGLTPKQVQERLAAQLVGIVQEPRVSVAISVPRPPRVAVTGEVATPGRYELHPGDGLLHAIAMAGGLTEFGRADRVFVLRQQPRPLRVRFDYEALAQGDVHGRSFELRDGDVVLVE